MSISTGGPADAQNACAEHVVIVDVDGVVRGAGASAAAALGVSADAARGVPVAALFRPGSEATVAALLERPDARTRILETAAGFDRQGAVAVVAHSIEGGTCLHVVDVTVLFGRAIDGDRLFDASIDLVCTLGLDGYFARVSPSFTTTLGWTEEELLSRPLVSFVHSDDVDATVAWLDALASGTPPSRFENRFGTAVGLWRTLQWASRIDDATGQAYSIARDVTAERDAAEQIRIARDAAEGANQAKTTFLARMSHELRTPLNAILGYSEMLAEDAEDPTVIADLERINDAGQQLLDLINGILDLTKIEAGQTDIYIETVALDELIESVAATVRPLALRNGNRFEVRSTAHGELQTDRRKLQQILLNLLANATRFTRGGVVVLHATGDDEAVTFAVEDTGIGMSAEDLVRAFRPFDQGRHVNDMTAAGTGLGLPIADRFARMIGARLDADSEPGRGSRFTVRVPRRHAAPAGRIDVTGGYLVMMSRP